MPVSPKVRRAYAWRPKKAWTAAREPPPVRAPREVKEDAPGVPGAGPERLGHPRRVVRVPDDPRVRPADVSVLAGFDDVRELPRRNDLPLVFDGDRPVLVPDPFQPLVDPPAVGLLGHTATRAFPDISLAIPLVRGRSAGRPHPWQVGWTPPSVAPLTGRRHRSTRTTAFVALFAPPSPP